MLAWANIVRAVPIVGPFHDTESFERNLSGKTLQDSAYLISPPKLLVSGGRRAPRDEGGVTARLRFSGATFGLYANRSLPITTNRTQAEINFAEERGVVQVETFGVSLNAEGTCFYGMQV